MTVRDNVYLTEQDIVPAWLRTLECEAVRKETHLWRGECFLRGRFQRFSVDSAVVDKGLNKPVSDTPVLVGTQPYPETSQNGRIDINLTGLSLMKPGVPLAVAQSLYGETFHTANVIQHIEQLLGLIAGLRTPLKGLLTDLFSDTDIAQDFVTCPASHKHHHAIPGGLLIHSVACALMVKQLSTLRLNPQEAEVTTVAALLHDTGKIRTHKPTGLHNVLGHCVSHESTGLEILAPYLKTLDEHWDTGASLLRHILEQDREGQRYPAFPGTLLVKMCDQFDTSLDLRNQSFDGKPDWYGYTWSDGATSQRFLRIPHQQFA